MRDRGFNFAIIFTFAICITTFNLGFAQTQDGLYLNSEIEIYKNHDVIIDLIDSTLSEQDTPEIIITSPIDTVSVDALYNGTLDGFRAIILAKPSAGNPNDNIIQAQDGDTITITSSGFTITRLFQVDNVGEPPNNRITMDDVPFCSQYANPNDIDGDGICDEWETGPELVITDERFPGVVYSFDCTMHGNDGCDDDKKDIFVELDWQEGHRPDPIAIQNVIDSFANAQESSINLDGIRLHLQVDPVRAYPHTEFLAFPGYDETGLRGFDQLKAISFGTPDERNNVTNPWSEARNLKHFVFHYTIFAHKIAFEDETQTGEAEFIGNDLIITLGKYAGKIGSTDQQEGTFMHELGHNLGLTHFGGNNTTGDTAPNKPNLFSVMTYVRQFSDYDEHRALDYSNQTLYHHHTSPELDPQHYSTWGIDENKLKEKQIGIFEYFGHENESIIYSCPDGIAGPMGYYTGGKVDWNCNGKFDKGMFVDHINNFTKFPDGNLTSMEGHNDWKSLIYNFSSNPGNYPEGRHDLVASGRTIEYPTDDPSFSYFTTGRGEVDHEIVTFNRISSLLALYRAVDLLEENNFNGEFSAGVNFWNNVNNTMILTEFQQNEPRKDSLKEVIFKIGEFLIPDAFADNLNASVDMPSGTSVPGCEDTDTCFIPSYVTVNAGGTVSWTNSDSAAHTVTGGSPDNGPSGVFDSSLVMGGALYEFTFDEKGNYDYFCMVHPWMVGSVCVSGPGNICLPPTPVLPNPQPGPQSEPKKDSFKQAIKEAINLINHHDVLRTKAAVLIIEDELMDKLHSSSDRKEIGFMTGNLLGTYNLAIGWAKHSISDEDVVDDPILSPILIEKMIKDVENHVDNVKSTQFPVCGFDYEKIEGVCECKNNEKEGYDEFCFDITLPNGLVISPHAQASLGIPAENIDCNYNFGVIVSNSTGAPACVESDSADTLIGWGWGKTLVATPIP